MPTPTDRGYAIIQKTAAGTYTIGVSVVKPEEGGLDHVHARYARQSSFVIDKSVTLVTSGDLAWTKSPVQVFVDPRGRVNVSPLAGNSRLRLSASVNG